MEKKLISHETLIAEKERLQAEEKKGLEHLENLNEQRARTETDILRIQGTIAVIESFLKDSNE
jgi:hypothetical protein